MPLPVAIVGFFKSIPGMIITGLSAIVLVMGLAFYFYVQWNEGRVDTLKENAVKYEQAVETQKQVIDQQRKDFDSLKQAVKILQQQDALLDKRYDDLVSRQARDNLGAVALKDPERVRTVITINSKESNRCFEILMGSKLTQAELAVTTKDKINSMCPDLANPNYKRVN